MLTCDVRCATICDSYAKAIFQNQENWRRNIAEEDGVLDKQVLEAALGKHRPKQLMWGLLGPITIGLSLELGSEQLLACNHPKYCPSAQEHTYPSIVVQWSANFW